MRRAIARRQTAWLWLFVVAVIAAQFVQLGIAVELSVLVALVLLAFVRAPRVAAEPREVAAPLRGTWVGLNSPADRVPSHGTRNFGQTYAMDVLHPSPPGSPTEIAWSPIAREPEEYSSFDQPVHAVAAGRVVIARNGRRDHLSRDSWPALMYMFVFEAFGRSLGGSGAILGNHVVLDHGEDSFSVYAHLRRGSVAVGPGDTVETGEVLGRVGNSGNTSEPHLHFQLMDRPHCAAAAGLPFRWSGIEQPAGQIDPTRVAKPARTEITPGLPAAGQVFHAGAAAGPADRAERASGSWR